MPLCGNCGAESSRVRSRWKENVQLPDECMECSLRAFVKFKSVRDGEIVMGHEYMPTMYKKTDEGYVPKDELTADTEALIVDSIVNSPEAVREREAQEHKRRTRRTAPMSQSEKERCIHLIERQASEAS